MAKFIRQIATLILLLLPLLGGAQQGVRVQVRGVVRDQATGKVLPYATILVRGVAYGGAHGTVSDERGNFELSYQRDDAERADTLEVSFVGYRDQLVYLKPYDRGYDKKNDRNHSYNQKVEVSLTPMSYAVEKVVVGASRQRYRKRNNPAVDLAMQLIAQRDDHRVTNHEHASWNRYEKIVFGINDAQKYINNNRPKAKQNDRIAEYSPFIDTVKMSVPPQIVMPVSVKEKLENCYYNKSRGSVQRIVVSTNNRGIDDFINQQNIMDYVYSALHEVDVFGGDINFIQRHFVGPLSRIAPSYYKFYLGDTVMLDSAQYVTLEFIPHNPKALGFVGSMLVSTDSTRFVAALEMNVPSSINLNFVDNLIITQRFKRGPHGEQLAVSDDVLIEVNVLGIGKIYVQRGSSYRDYCFDEPEEVVSELLSSGKRTIQLPTEKLSPPARDYLWNSLRHSPLTTGQNNVEALANHMRRKPLYVLMETATKILMDGYVETSRNSRFDIGPVLSLVSGNSLEGTRFTLGGFTTAALSSKIFFEGYVGYGLKDEKVKYQAALEYSFRNKERQLREFPVHSLRVEYKYDIHSPGRVYNIGQQNVISWLRRRTDNWLTYRRMGEITYTHEYENHFSFQIFGRHYREYESVLINFDDFGLNNQVTDHGRGFYSMAELELRLRYAPHEKLYQTKNKRYRSVKENPVFELSHTTAVKGFLGSDYNTNRTEFFTTKRFTFAPFGYIDAEMRMGAQWNTVPFMLLPMPNANLTYIIREGAYALMNPMEFAYDKYISLDVSYYLDGLLFNRIPFLRWLGWREVLTFRTIYGHLGRHNNPQFNTSLPNFAPNTFLMNRGPYMEVGIGIENIFKILRIDYVRRINYLGHPGIDANGVQFTARFKF